MANLITVIHVITCVLLVLVIMIQSGKGAEISASFGGSSQTVFGSSGGANFFVKFTQGAAAVFMITSLALTILGGQARKSLFDTTPASNAATNPVVPAQPTQPTAPAANAQAPAAQQPAAEAAKK